jgi:hypothetical protein
MQEKKFSWAWVCTKLGPLWELGALHVVAGGDWLGLGGCRASLSHAPRRETAGQIGKEPLDKGTAMGPTFQVRTS